MDETKLPPKTPMRVVVVGDSGVGKSSLIKMFTQHTFSSSHVPTVGIDFAVRSIEIESTKATHKQKKDSIATGSAPPPPPPRVKLQIWDCAGQDKFRCITRSYFRDARAVLLMFDLTDRNSFDSLDNWLSDVLHEVSDKCIIWLLGNKSDLLHGNKESDVLLASSSSPKQQQQDDYVHEWANHHGIGIHYVPCCVRSNLENQNIDKLFQQLATALYNRFLSDEILLNSKSPSVTLVTNPVRKDICCTGFV